MSDNPILDFYAATSYAKHSSRLKCYMHNELVQELNLIKLLIPFQKLNLNISLIMSNIY